MSRPAKDYTGYKVGRLTVLYDSGERVKDGHKLWIAKCGCGNYAIITTSQIAVKNKQSCGCLKKENWKGTKHSMCYTKIYSTWNSMLNRCYNSNDKRFHNYGKRGIKVCKRWHKFENFYADMGNKPAGKTLERTDNDKGYFPNNCKWATSQEQHENIRVKGYSYDKESKKYRARITTNGKNYHLGGFDAPEEARNAYLEAKKIYHTTHRE